MLQGSVTQRGSSEEEQSASAHLAHKNQPANQMSNSALPGFDGWWESVTEVTASSIPSVPIGIRTVSRVRFLRLPDGSLEAKWKQDGWTRSYEKINEVATGQAFIARQNVGTGMNVGYLAQSHDYYSQLSSNELSAASLVDVVANGNYLGRYQTASVLHRVQPSHTGSCHLQQK